MQLNGGQRRELLLKLSNRNFFKSIKRIEGSIDVEYCLDILTEIGKSRCPSFQIDDSNKFLFTNVLYWLYGDKRCTAMDPETTAFTKGDLNKGFYIFGNTGTGKSVALDVIKVYSTLMEIPIIIDGKEENLFWENYRTTDICTEFANNGTFGKCIKSKVLGLQDIGSEERETLYMGNRINVIQQILETRGDANDNLTFITSNIPMTFEKISHKYNDRVASRLQEMCNFYVLAGKDRRLAK